MIIYLADIYHASGKPSTPTPTNIGFIASYCMKKFGKNVEIKLFKNPQMLLNEIDKKSPDLLGLSNYMWNENLNKFICNYAKEKNPNLITVTGGPNLRTDKASIKKFLVKNKEYDFCILYAAEIPFSNLVQCIFDRKRDELKSEKIEGCFFINKKIELVGEVFLSEEKNLDYIPSPFLNGLMDNFIDEGYFPLYETNRGCPFSCTFCVWGISALHKIKTFSLERVKSEFNYVANNFQNSTMWFLADANFGILPRDVEIAELIRDIYDKTNAFDLVILYWTKNVTDKSYKIAKTLGKLCEAYVALQSLDPQVLKLIKRNNISIEKLLHFKNEVGPYTKGSLTDILLGQPGETKQSHINSFYGAMKLGFDQIGGGEIRLLPGSEMDEDQSRRDYGLKTKFRIGEGSLGMYRDKFIFEVEEVVRSTNWITEDEMLDLRSVRALVYTATTLGELSPLNSVLVNNDINILKVFEDLIKNANKNTALYKMIIELDNLAKNEWFESRESAIEYYNRIAKPDNLEKISPIKLNFWVLAKMLKSSQIYEDFLLEFKNSVLKLSNKVDEKTLDELLNICRERNYIRSILKGDISINKELPISEKTFKELVEAKVVGDFLYKNKVFLKIPSKLSLSLQKKCKNFDTLNELEVSMLIQDYSMHIQMLIDSGGSLIAEDSKNSQFEVVNQGNLN